MKGWEIKKLKSVAEFLNRGISPKYSESGIQIINQKCIRNNVVDLSLARFSSVEKKIGFERILKPYDILVNSTGTGTLGRTAQIKSLERPTSVDTHVTIVRPSSEVDKVFLAYQVSLKEPEIVSLGKGATNQQELGREELGQIELLLPPLSTQQKIASILSAYDDLIENNLKRIKLLEELAQRTYEEWFVKFSVNGQKLEVNPETGLPEGWESKPFSEVVQVNPRTKLTNAVSVPFVPMSSLSETSMVIDPIFERDSTSGTKFINGDTLFARITPCLENGKTGFVQFLSDSGQVGLGSTEYIVLRKTTFCNEFFIYLTSRTDKFRNTAINSMVGSDGRQRVQPDFTNKFIIAIPSSELMDSFGDVAQPIFKLVQTLVDENKGLKESRDILLPRLMSGDISVESMEQENLLMAAEDAAEYKINRK